MFGTVGEKKKRIELLPELLMMSNRKQHFQWLSSPTEQLFLLLLLPQEREMVLDYNKTKGGVGNLDNVTVTCSCFFFTPNVIDNENMYLEIHWKHQKDASVQF